MSGESMAEEARIAAMTLLRESLSQPPLQQPITLARAQVWATLAVSLELASGSQP